VAAGKRRDDRESLTRVAAARLVAATARPYYSAALFALEPTRSPDGDTRYVTVDTAGRLWWNETINDEPVAVLAARIVHGLEHLLRGHADRGRDWIPVIGGESWAVACDCEIDDDLTDLELPDDLPTAAAFGWPDGRAAEWYAGQLRPQPPEETESGEGPTDPDEADGASRFEHNKAAGGCDCPALTGEMIADVADSPGLSEARIQILREETAAEVASHKGRVPGHAARWAEQSTAVKKVDWRRVLARHIRQAKRRIVGASDYCYRRPSRRSPARVLLPRLRGIELRPAIVIDTSGSMASIDLRSALDQVDQLLATVTSGEGVPVIACDTEVNAVVHARNSDDVVLDGGGGSDMTPGIEAAQQGRADLVVVITDGEVDWPKHTPKIPVIAALLGHYTNPDDVPSWIHTVVINDISKGEAA